MNEVSINKSINLSEHITLGEVTKSRHAEVYNIPSHVAIENLKRVCSWLEELRKRYNLRYVLRSFSPPKLGGARGGLKERYNSHCSDHPAHTGTPPNLGGEKDTPIIINSGYRSPQLNKRVGGVSTSNHLTGCAVDIRCSGFLSGKSLLLNASESSLSLPSSFTLSLRSLAIASLRIQR